MKISECEFSKIKQWIRVNKDVIKNVYALFLSVCNEKHGLKLIDSKQLFFDLSLYLYYNTEDKYGATLFNNNEEKKNYLNSLNNDKNKYYYYLINNIKNDEQFNEEYEQQYNNDSYSYKKDLYEESYDEKESCNKKEFYKNESSELSFSENEYDNFDDCYTDEYWEELYNKFFNNDDPTLYHFVPHDKN